MTVQPIILLDDGGVMNDNRLRRDQWPPLVGEFFAPRLGGTIEAWAEANRTVVQHFMDLASWLQRLEAAADYTHFEQTYWLDWLQGMAQLVQVPLPSVQECIQLAREAEEYIIPHVHSAFPGVCEAIKQLHAEDYVLHTASGESSVHLTHYLGAMQVRHCFGQLYGPDLLNTFKTGPDYYAQIFAQLQIAPGDALIVDDNPGAISWASSLGARTVLVGASKATDNKTIQINNLAELPDLLQGLT
ncbi:hypothetical protein KDW_44080 [Dictyobacter vulcani]|uniref:Hydrolase n=1 Tax=Dictyobacter vulcani TaxID=2607529 RepID=A0A5J4KYL9_9CHLR|nr:HAD hydrolase-like protein [Dictyobacter vulcani]GER90246.1 hypothetical protein KDW_44080 [Dictyobacter vulcani]